MNTTNSSADNVYLKSTFYEQLVEHVFISEILQDIWYCFGEAAEVLRSEIDASGYDVVIECKGVVRHIQLKTSKANGKTNRQKVNVALADKPSGCVVWITRHEDKQSCRMKLSYRFFGGHPGQPLPTLENLKVAKHSKGNAQGEKKKRKALRVLPIARFEAIPTTRELVQRLFGLSEQPNQIT